MMLLDALHSSAMGFFFPWYDLPVMLLVAVAVAVLLLTMTGWLVSSFCASTPCAPCATTVNVETLPTDADHLIPCDSSSNDDLLSADSSLSSSSFASIDDTSPSSADTDRFVPSSNARLVLVRDVAFDIFRKLDVSLSFKQHWQLGLSLMYHSLDVFSSSSLSSLSAVFPPSKFEPWAHSRMISYYSWHCLSQHRA